MANPKPRDVNSPYVDKTGAATTTSVDSDGNALGAQVDGRLDCVLYLRYTPPDDLAHVLSDAGTLPTSWRTVVIQTETNTIRLVDDGTHSPSAGTNGAPLQLGSMYAYTPVDSTKIKFCNATAGQTAIVHLYFYKGGIA